MIPSARGKKVLVLGFELDREDTVAVAMFLSELSFEVVAGFLGLLIVDADNAIETSCGKIATIVGVIEGEDLIVGFYAVPELFACFGQELEEVTVGVGG